MAPGAREPAAVTVDQGRRQYRALAVDHVDVTHQPGTVTVDNHANPEAAAVPMDNGDVNLRSGALAVDNGVTPEPAAVAVDNGGLGSRARTVADLKLASEHTGR